MISGDSWLGDNFQDQILDLIDLRIEMGEDEGKMGKIVKIVDQNCLI